MRITGSYVSCGITIVRIEEEILTDIFGAQWSVMEFSCCNNGQYWSGHGLKVNKDGNVGGRYSKSIVLDIPDAIRNEAVQYYVKGE